MMMSWAAAFQMNGFGFSFQWAAQVLEAICWRYRTGSPWRDLPEELGRWHVNCQIIWHSFAKLFVLLGADDQHLSGGVDYLGRDGLQLVDRHDAGDLCHEPFDQPEVAAGDGGDRVGGFGVGWVGGVVGAAELLPVVRQDDGDVFGIYRPVLMGEADAAVELRVAGELPLEPGHADQDQPDVVAVEEVAELLEGVGLEPVSLVDL